MKNLKKKIGILMLVIVLCVAGFYGYQYYLFNYRYNFEPETDLTETNTEALKDLDSLNETILKYSNNTINATDENSYVIPGLIATKTLNNKKISMCTSMTPQGICLTENYIFISAYCHTHEHNSVLYMLDKNTHAFIKEIVIKGKYHLGNICYDPENKNIWVAATGENPLTGKECAYLNVLSLEDIEAYSLEDSKKAISFKAKYPLTGFKNASFISYYKGNIFVGIYYTGIWKNAYVQRFPMDENGNLETKKKEGKTVAAGKEKAKISGLCQGIYFTDDYIAIMESSGTDDSVVQYYANSAFKEDCDTMISLDQIYKAYVKKEEVVEDIEKQFETIQNDYKKAIQKEIEVDQELNVIINSLMKLYNNEFDILEKFQTLFSDEYTEKEYQQLTKKLETIQSKISKENKEFESYKENHENVVLNAKFIEANQKMNDIQNSLSTYEKTIQQYKEAVDSLPAFDEEEYLEKLKETKEYDLSNSQATITLTFPPRLEQAMESSLEDSKIYCLFESAAYAYRAQNDEYIDRVVVIDRIKE